MLFLKSSCTIVGITHNTNVRFWSFDRNGMKDIDFEQLFLKGQNSEMAFLKFWKCLCMLRKVRKCFQLTHAVILSFSASLSEISGMEVISIMHL